MNGNPTELFNKMKEGLVVSCQAEGDDPFNTPEGVSLFARAAEMGGAVGIRSEGLEKTREIIGSVELPVIGLLKRKFPDSSVCITRKFEDVRQLYDIGCSIIAIDGTERKFGRITGPELIEKVKKEIPECIVMADIAAVEDAGYCIHAGADCLSTTLSGYTPETAEKTKNKPDLALVEHLAGLSDLPVFAEGRFNTPNLARQAIEKGAWAVVVGTAITRPRVVTRWFSDAMKKEG